MNYKKPEVPYKTIASFYYRDPSPYTLVGSNRFTVCSYNKRPEPLSSLSYAKNVNEPQPITNVMPVVNNPTNRAVLRKMERDVIANQPFDLSRGLDPSLHYGDYTPQQPANVKGYEMHNAATYDEKPIGAEVLQPYIIPKLSEGFISSAVGGTDSVAFAECKARPSLNISAKNEIVLPSIPDVFGPPLWFSLHTTAANYPIKPTVAVQAKMKGIILGLPLMVPCLQCGEHCTAFIEKSKADLDTIVSSRDNLFKYFVDFHNAVNRRKHKPEVSLDDAWKMYTGKAVLERYSY